MLVAEMPLQRDGRSPTAAMARGDRDGSRAPRLPGRPARVGYRLCDDSTAAGGDLGRREVRGQRPRLRRDPDVVIEVGPYNSGCARRQIPIAATAPRGPLAMLSATNTHRY